MIHIGIIGLGAIGQRLIKQFNEHPDTNIVAVCDRMESLTKETAEQLGGIAAYTNHLDLVNDQKVDLVYVAVPPKFHHQIVIDVVNANKHLLCEKPLANSVEEAEDMYKLANEAGVIHAMNFPLNYSPGAGKFAQLINEGFIGNLRRLQLTMHFPEWPRAWQKNDWVGGREQGGFVLEVGVHFIQQIQKIFGDIKNVTTRLELPDDPEKSETGIIATAELSDGTPILVEGLSHIAGKEHIALTAFGSEGVLSLQNWAELKGAKNGEEMTTLQVDDMKPNSLIHHIVEAVKGNEAEIFNFEAGFKAQVILEELRKL